MKHLFVVLLSTLSLSLFGQELTNGLIMPNPNGPFKSCCVYIPASGLTAYDVPNGKQIAQLQQGTSDHNGEVYKALIKIGEDLTELDYSNLYMVGYEIMALVYVDKRGDFVKINNGYWLSIKELQSKGLMLTTWMDYLINKEDVLGWYANKPGLNLRTGASTNSDIIATLKGDLWEITPTSETKGLWCKVTVKEYTKHPCSGQDYLIKRTLTGWVKLLSENQTPNVWNYGKGC
ncbi:MAG: SH3 domain-containing protein [Roseivirga sp.]|nr:SH3 domain-containing protein [Roseivirga sp.]